MILTLIVAIAQNGVIGRDNDLIWKLPVDLQHFKDLTLGHTIIMGRKTWESIGSRPLPKRTHIVISRNSNYKADGALVVTSLKEAILNIKNDDQPFIVGGAQIYKEALQLVNRLEITHVHHSFDGDTFFPEWNKENWKLVSEMKHHKDDRHAYDFTFSRYDRKN